MNKTKILFIDDEQEILNAYASIFNKKKKENPLSQFVQEGKFEISIESFWDEFDFETEFASSGEEGVLKVKKAVEEKAPFQIVFIDMRMPPGINGAETAGQIRKEDSLLEIVIITAYSDLSINKINSMVGRPDKLIYMKKPFYNEEIRQIILNLTIKYQNERIKDDFIYKVSHELRNPLSAISGLSQLLLSSKKINKKEKESIHIIQENSLLIKSLIEKFLNEVS